MPRRRIANAIRLLLVVATLAVALPPTAGAADYTVRLTTTAGGHWTSFGGTPFIVVPQRVYSGIGNFTTGDYRSWRMGVPGEGARIVGGRISVTSTTPDAAMRARIVVGSGNTPVVLYDGGDNGTIERSITSGAHDWIQFDLRAAAAVKTSQVGTNWVNLAAAELVLRDTVPPVVTPLSLPAPTTWYGAGACIPFSLRVSDQGGGLARAMVRSATTGAIITDWIAPVAASPKPGPTEQQLDDCIQPSERAHGDTLVVATVWDVSGVAREVSFQVRADHALPSITGGPGDGTRYTVAEPDVQFDVADDGAGIAGVSASLDGAPVPVTLEGSRARITVGRLGEGAHVVAIGVADAAGNGNYVSRRILVGDATPPTLALGSPGARGDATTELSVSASDDMSGIDPTSWTALVDGAEIVHRGESNGLTAKLGPLEPGTHGIEVSVKDRAGNVARIVHDYYVIPPPPPEPEAPAIVEAPGRSALDLVDAPRTPVGFGQQATVSVHVAQLGRSVGAQLVEVRRDGAVVGSAVTDTSGVARIQFVAKAPGSYLASAVGMALEPVDTGLQVAPRLVLATSTQRPRVGERVALTGRIIPAIRGRRVAVEARVGGVWYPIRRAASTNAAGVFRSTVVANAPGTVWVRVRLLAVGAWAPAISNQRALTTRS